MLQPKETQIKLQDGTTKMFVLHKFPAIAGREIIAKYPLTSMPKVGDYATNEETMLKLMSFVGVTQDNGNVLMLTTKALVENHVPDWEALARIEMGMIEYNCSFFSNGAASTLLDSLRQKAESMIPRMLTNLLQQLSSLDKPPSESSGKSTH